MQRDSFAYCLVCSCTNTAQLNVRHLSLPGIVGPSDHELIYQYNQWRTQEIFVGWVSFSGMWWSFVRGVQSCDVTI